MRRTCVLLALSFVVLAAGGSRGGVEDAAPPSVLDEKLSGWDGLIKEYWSYKDGTLVGNAKADPKFNTFLCSKKKYKDFEMSFKVRLKGPRPNSGVQIRSEVVDDKKWIVKGPQADIGKGYWGSLYGERFGGMMQAAAKETQKDIKQDDFNDYSIKVVGKKVTIKVNGVTTVDKEFEKLPAEGIIAFQLHAGGPMEVTYKDIKFKELKGE